jgi:hypothetical protein
MNAGSHRVAAIAPSLELAARPLASGGLSVRGREVWCWRLRGLSVRWLPAGGSGSGAVSGAVRCRGAVVAAPVVVRQGAGAVRPVRSLRVGVGALRFCSSALFEAEAQAESRGVVQALVVLAACESQLSVPSLAGQLTPPSSGRLQAALEAAAHVER